MPFGKDTNDQIAEVAGVFERTISVIFPVFGLLLLFVSYKLLTGPESEISQKLGHGAWKIGALLNGVIVIIKLIRYRRKRNSNE